MNREFLLRRAEMTNTYTKSTLTRAVLEEGVKLRIKSEEHNEAFQAKCFELGVSWSRCGSSRVLPLSVGAYIFVKRDAETGRTVMTWGGAKDAPHLRRIFYSLKGEDKKVQYEPFDLERALSGEPVVLKDGKKAYVRYCERDFQTLYPLLGYTEVRGYNIPLTWSKCGKQDVDHHGEFDIVGMFPQNKEVHGVEVPTFPLWKPQLGDMVYVVRLDLFVPIEIKLWKGTPRDMCALERGLVFPYTNQGHKAARLLAKTLVTVIQEG